MTDVTAEIKSELAKSRPKVTLEKIAEKLTTVTGEHQTGNMVWNMLNGRTPLPPHLVEEVRKLLKKPDNWPETAVGAYTRVPLTGPATETAGAYSFDPDSETVKIPGTFQGTAEFARIVEDDGMMPTLEPGALALFKAASHHRRGYIYLVQIEGKAPEIRSVEWASNSWWLRPTNRAHDDAPLTGARILGLLVGWYRRHGDRETSDGDPNGLLA